MGHKRVLHGTIALRGAAVLSLIAFGLAVGCESQKTAQSGFLRDYGRLKPNPAMDGALQYQNPRIRLDQYKKFMIDPIVVHFAPNAEGTAMDPAKLTELTSFFREEAVKALSEQYQVVEQPGPGVLRIRAAITDIQKTQPLMNIHPATKLSGVGLGGASMEAEALDAQTNERVLAVVDSRQGDRMAIAAGLDEVGHAKQVMKFWIDRFVKRLDEAHGYQGK